MSALQRPERGARRAGLGLLGLGLLGLGLLGGGEARAQSTGEALQVEGPPGGVVELAPGKGAMEGSVTVRNAGTRPLSVRARLLDSDADTRLPRGLSSRFERQSEQVQLAPGEAQKLELRWTPSTSRAREAYGHVVIEAPGSRRVVGIHAEPAAGLSGLLSRGWLSLMVLVPLLGAIVAALGKPTGREAQARRASQALAALHAMLAAGLMLMLDRQFGRSDGNEGLQFIERHGGAIELYLGADGGSALVGALVATAGLIGAGVAAEGTTLALGSLLASALTLATFSQDLVVLWLALATALGSLIALAPATLRRGLAVLAAASLGLLGATVGALGSGVDGALDAAGHPVARSFALASILRSDHLGRAWLGMPLAASALGLLVAFALPWLPLWPFDAWTRRWSREGTLPAVACALPAVTLLTLLRVGVLGVPEGVGWAATTLGALGAVGALLAGLGAWSEREASARWSWLLGVQSGLALVGLGAGTPQGLLGALVSMVAAGLGGVLLSRAAEGGLVGWWSTRVGWLLAAGAPSTLGFWGAGTVLLGAFPLHPWSALGALLGWLLAVAAAVRAMTSSDEERPASEPVGTPWVGVGLLVVSVVLGLAPGVGLSALERWSLDLAAFVSPPGPGQVARK